MRALQLLLLCACSLRACSALIACISSLARVLHMDTFQAISRRNLLRFGSQRGCRAYVLGADAARHAGALMRLAGDEGARGIIRDNRDSLVLIEVDEAGVVMDIDTPDSDHTDVPREAGS